VTRAGALLFLLTVMVSVCSSIAASCLLSSLSYGDGSPHMRSAARLKRAHYYLPHARIPERHLAAKRHFASSSPGAMRWNVRQHGGDLRRRGGRGVNLGERFSLRQKAERGEGHHHTFFTSTGLLPALLAAKDGRCCLRDGRSATRTTHLGTCLLPATPRTSRSLHVLFSAGSADETCFVPFPRLVHTGAVPCLPLQYTLPHFSACGCAWRILLPFLPAHVLGLLTRDGYACHYVCDSPSLAGVFRLERSGVWATTLAFRVLEGRLAGCAAAGCAADRTVGRGSCLWDGSAWAGTAASLPRIYQRVTALYQNLWRRWLLSAHRGKRAFTSCRCIAYWRRGVAGNARSSATACAAVCMARCGATQLPAPVAMATPLAALACRSVAHRARIAAYPACGFSPHHRGITA